MTVTYWSGPREAGIRVRYWIVNCLSGEVQSEMPLTKAALTLSDEGGTLSGEVDLNAAIRRTGERTIPDWPEIRRRINLVRPGLNSIVATDDRRRMIGEWIITGRRRVTSATSMPVSGVAWEQYPKYRALESARKHTNIDSLALLRALLGEVFTGVTYVTAGPTTSGVAIDMDRASNAGYYADALSEITRGDPAVEWGMEIGGVWSGDALTSVTRTLRFGAPAIQRPTALVFEAGEPMTRQGNSVITGGDDWTLYAHKVIGVGSGSGSKQLIASASDPAPVPGMIRSTRLLQAGEVASQSALNSVTRQALNEGLSTREPWHVQASVGELAKLPQPYDSARLIHRQSYTHPGPGGGLLAIDEVVRVGEVRYQVDGPICEVVEVDLG